MFALQCGHLNTAKIFAYQAVSRSFLIWPHLVVPAPGIRENLLSLNESLAKGGCKPLTIGLICKNVTTELS